MSILPDVLTPGLAVVFCGTAASSASARRRAYYAGPGNAFWPTLFEIGLIPRPLAPAEYHRLPTYGLGLTDLAKDVSGSDNVLSDNDFDREGLEAKIRRYAPAILAFTSKRAAEEYLRHPVQYGRLQDAIEGTQFFVLPSPSGAARRFWDTGPWRQLAQMASTKRDPAKAGHFRSR